MRLWSLHPGYLDAKGLVALWREVLLAQAVLTGKTRGYRSHPQLERFRQQASPAAALAAYLQAVYEEAVTRDYSFDASKTGEPSGCEESVPVTDGQLAYKWRHLLSKLHDRAPDLLQQWLTESQPQLHPLFQRRDGDVEDWERTGTIGTPA